MNETEDPSITPVGEANSIAPPSTGWVMSTAATVHEELVETPRDSLEASTPSPITSLDSGDDKAADKMSDTAKPKTTPQLKEKLGLMDLTFSTVFIVVGLTAIVIALGVKIDLWELNLALLGIADMALLLDAFVTAHEQIMPVHRSFIGNSGFHNPGRGYLPALIAVSLTRVVRESAMMGSVICRSL